MTEKLEEIMNQIIDRKDAHESANEMLKHVVVSTKRNNKTI